jgi:hypothetical protein
MTRLRKECDDLKAAEIRALKAKKEGELLLLRDLEEGGASGSTRAADLLLDIKKEEDIKKEGDEGEVDSKAGVLDAEGGSPDSGGTAEAAAAAAARMAELKVGLRIPGSFSRVSGSGSGSRRAKMTRKSRKN